MEQVEQIGNAVEDRIANIASRIKQRREEKGWSQRKFGADLDMTGKQVSNYENRIALPPIRKLLEICEKLDCEPGYLFGEQDYSEGTKLRTAVNKVTGLSEEAMIKIRDMTDDGGSSRIFYHEDAATYRKVLDALICSNWFSEFIEDLCGYVADVKSLEGLEENEKRVMIETMGKEKYEKAREQYDQMEKQEEESWSLSFSDSDIKDHLLLTDSIDRMIEHSFEAEQKIRYARYKLFTSFEKWIDDAFPVDLQHPER